MSITIAALAAALNAPFVGDGEVIVSSAAEPQDAGPGDLALAMDPKFAPNLAKGQARAAVLWQGADWQALGLKAAILVTRGRLAMAGITASFADMPVAQGIHPTAVIDPSAEIGAGVAIGPYTVIGAEAKIGANSRLAAQVMIGAGVTLGTEALLHPGVKIGARARIGDRFIAQSGAVIGADGFSFVTAEKSHVEEARESLGSDVEAAGQTWLRIASIGSVEIGDDVEIGANSVVDQGTIRATRIGDGTKLDNLVQVGHNVVIGRHCLLCGQAGIAGSSVIGDFSVLGGKAGVIDNIKIGSGAILGAGSIAHSNVPKGKAMMGNPAVAMQTNVEMYKALRRLPRLLKRLNGAD